MRGGHHHDDFAHTGHLGRHGVHQYRAGIGGLATGHVDANAVQRGDLLAQQGAVFVFVAPGMGQLFLVVATDPFCGGAQGLLHFGRQTQPGGFQLLARQGEFGHGGGLHAVEAIGVFQYCSITACLDVIADGGHGAVHCRVLRGFKGQQCLQLLLEISLGRRQFQHGIPFLPYAGTAEAKASSTGWMRSYLSLSAA